MFELCKNGAFARSKEVSKKALSFKVSESEYEAIKELMEFHGEIYSSNVIRIALKKIYEEMQLANAKK